MMSFKDQRILIMGGTSGIGLATAKAAAKKNASVVITGRNPEKLKTALAQLPAQTTGETVDAASVRELEDFFKKTGKFDHLVLSLSGKQGAGLFSELDSDVLRRAFDAKFWVCFNALKTGAGYISPAGSVVFVTAMSARTPVKGTSGLGAVNGALEAMVPTLALEMKPLRVNAVSPGVVRTPWWDTLPEEQREAVFNEAAKAVPVGRIGEPEDIAQAIMFLLDNTFMSGTIIECDGGLRIK